LLQIEAAHGSTRVTLLEPGAKPVAVELRGRIFTLGKTGDTAEVTA
jgi:hypothetical protein